MTLEARKFFPQFWRHGRGLPSTILDLLSIPTPVSQIFNAGGCRACQ